MRILAHSFFVLLLVALYGCNSSVINHKSDLFGVWKLSDIRPSENEKLSFEEEAKLKQQVAEGQTIALFGDDTFTKLSEKGNYTKGKWRFSLSPDEIELKEGSKKALSGFVRLETDKSKMTYLLVQEPNKNYRLVYRKESGPRKDVADEPYHPSNNEWRIRSKKPESEKDLKQKLSAYIKHISLILRAASEDKNDVVSFAYSVGPVLLYRGGIGVYEYDIVPASWKNIFSSDQKALEAYEIYKSAVRDNDYNGAGSGDWVLDDSNILMSIYTDISK